jgi:predicted phosphodiesterase
VAAIYDIHGNLPALEAVLKEVRAADVDLIIVGGDILPGPMPRESLACLFNAGISFKCIRGNGEREALALAAGASSTLPVEVQAAVKWSGEQLSEEEGLTIHQWPPTRRVDIEGLGPVLFCHATPRNDTEIFTKLTPEANLVSVFAGAGAPIVVCGHTHMQFDRTIGDTRVVNAGSVGMPFGATGAYWLLLGPGVEFRKTSYDLDGAAVRIRATRYPGAADFARRNVMSAPSEEETLKSMGAVEIKPSTPAVAADAS